MKKIFKYIFAGFVGCASLSSCLDDALQTAPLCPEMVCWQTLMRRWFL